MCPLTTLLALVLAQAPPTPQAPVRPQTLPSTTAPRPAGTGAGYRIGAGDVLHVAVYGHGDLDQTVIVQPDGRFLFPLIGSVPAEGATTGETEERISARLADGFIRDAYVSVTVEDYRSQVVYVVGEVSRPGAFPLAGETRVVEILARAGPLTRDAGSEVLVVRPAGDVDGPVLPGSAAPRPGGSKGGAAPAAEVLHVDLRAIQAGRLDENFALRANDTVFVPVAERIFVTGEVRSPGAFSFQRGITARQAVALAGGFTEDASTGSAKVVRDARGTSQTVKIRLDEPLRPGDIVVIKKAWF